MITLEEAKALIKNRNISNDDLNEVVSDFEVLSDIIIDSYLDNKTEKNKSPP